MLFNSLEFLLFLPLVFLLYWFVFNKNLKLQNIFLILISYFFYGWWDWRFLSLLAFSSIIDFLLGLILGKIQKQTQRKLIVFISVAVNLGFLGIFKYYNFFVDSFISLFHDFGIELQARTLNIILPVGISFYTFQSLSYTLDVYKRKMEPTKDLAAFLAFVSFFPQLVAGPIERATNLLPQINKKRNFDYLKAVDGMRQILWGFFKKIVIADNCSGYVNNIFDNYQTLPSSTLVVGAFYFAFQIYCDFSGYSDIAIGTARLFGIDLMRNFAFPYFSRDIAEFWRRWHISLTTWFRDYLYFPLGGSRGTIIMVLRNTLIVFVLSGFWHGANFTFIAWGLLNAIYFIPLLIVGKNRKNLGPISENRNLPSLKTLFQILSTFTLTIFAWIFFRAKSIEDAFLYIKHIFTKSILTIPDHTGLKMILPFIFLLIVVEWFQRDKQHGLEIGFLKSAWLRRLMYLIIIYMIFTFGNFNKTEFIYFAF